MGFQLSGDHSCNVWRGRLRLSPCPAYSPHYRPNPEPNRAQLSPLNESNIDRDVAVLLCFFFLHSGSVLGQSTPGVCGPPESYCATCDVTNTTCTSCYNGSSLNTTFKICQQCYPHCQSCMTNGYMKCDYLGCETGYFRDPSTLQCFPLTIDNPTTAITTTDPRNTITPRLTVMTQSVVGQTTTVLQTTNGAQYTGTVQQAATRGLTTAVLGQTTTVVQATKTVTRGLTNTGQNSGTSVGSLGPTVANTAVTGAQTENVVNSTLATTTMDDGNSGNFSSQTLGLIIGLIVSALAIVFAVVVYVVCLRNNSPSIRGPNFSNGVNSRIISTQEVQYKSRPQSENAWTAPLTLPVRYAANKPPTFY